MYKPSKILVGLSEDGKPTLCLDVSNGVEPRSLSSPQVVRNEVDLIRTVSNTSRYSRRAMTVGDQGYFKQEQSEYGENEIIVQYLVQITLMVLIKYKRFWSCVLNTRPS